MFCPNCGANQPDGSSFCGNCGSPLNSDPFIYQQPAYACRPETPVRKREYLRTLASPQTMSLTKVVWCLLVVCLLILALGWNASVNGPFYEIPVFKLALGEDYAEAMDELSDLEDGVDEIRDQYEDEINENNLDELVNSIDSMAKNPSLRNVRDVAQRMNDCGIEDMEREFIMIFDVAIAVLTACFAFIALFTVLGALFKSAGLTVFALVISVPIFGLFSGTLYIAVALVAYIAQTVVLSKINKEYKAYKNGQIPAYIYN